MEYFPRFWMEKPFQLLRILCCSFTIKEDQNKILEDKLTEAAIALSDFEPRVKMRDSGEDVKVGKNRLF